jgi:ornithine carbamoyltransferase
LGGQRGLLSIGDLSTEDVWQLIRSAVAMKQGADNRSLEAKAGALLFEKPSLRTRVSFDIALWQLGGHAVYLSPAEVGLGGREQVQDVARTLSRYVQVIIARTFSQETIQALAKHATIPVVNALSDMEHPCQALGDLLTIYEKRGELDGLNLAFIGDANNVANSLLMAAARVGMNFCIACPPGYEPQDWVMEDAQRHASQKGSSISCTTDPSVAANKADVVYTDVWISMGQEDQGMTKVQRFEGYQVTEELLSKASAEVLLMHPLPAHHGEEIVPGLLDHPRSIVFDQAENRLHIQKAILVKLLSDV